MVLKLLIKAKRLIKSCILLDRQKDY